MQNDGTMDDKELRGLITKLDKKYGKEIAAAFAVLDDKCLSYEEKTAELEKSFDKQFAWLFMRMEKRFSDIEAKLDDKADKTQADLILGTLDTVLKNQETEEQERLVVGHQLSRHEQWFDQLAAKARTKLVPGR